MSDQLKKPGEIAQKSGQYEITGPRGGGTGQERTVTKAKIEGSCNQGQSGMLSQRSTPFRGLINK